MSGTWYCRCGQANAAHFAQCVLCRANKEEGASTPFPPDAVTPSGKLLFPPKPCGHALSDALVGKARLSVTPDRIIIVESHRTGWAVLLILAALTIMLSGIFWESRGPGALVAGVALGSGLMLFAGLCVFGHRRVVIDRRENVCRAERRWLIVTLGERSFPLDAWTLTAERELRTVTAPQEWRDKKEAMMFWAFIALITFGFIAYYPQGSDEEDIFMPTLAITHVARNETWYLMTFADERNAHNIFAAIRPDITEESYSE